MFIFDNKKLNPVSKKTLKELQIKESDLEEILRANIEILTGEDESLLIVGQQVRNKAKSRSDLIAIDNNGYLVLIEIKRDKLDVINRKEPFEIQAIRYAASNATIKDYKELVERVYAPYIEKHKDEYNLQGKSVEEFALKSLEEFLIQNNAFKTFNQKQRLILVASEIDDQTKSAIAWLNQNGLDIQCFELDVYLIENKIYFQPQRILPLLSYSDFYVGFKTPGQKSSPTTGITRRNLPRIDELLRENVVSAGNIIIPKDYPGEAILLKNGNVDVHGEEMSMQVWLKGVYGWASIQTYVFAIQKSSGKSLSQLRKEYMDKAEEELLQGNED
jgi:hypothetical protein